MMPLAVLRQHVADVEIRQREHVAQVLLVFLAIQPPERPAPVREDFRAVGVVDGSGE